MQKRDLRAHIAGHCAPHHGVGNLWHRVRPNPDPPCLHRYYLHRTKRIPFQPDHPEQRAQRRTLCGQSRDLPNAHQCVRWAESRGRKVRIPLSFCSNFSPRVRSSQPLETLLQVCFFYCWWSSAHAFLTVFGMWEASEWDLQRYKSG